jgi:CBS domain containing-hemolysin-like protein
MSESPLVVVPVTVLLVALSAFFVAVEFAALAAKRHRLEEAAPTSRSARAALRNSSELTLVLAGSQLGITACTLALGALSKPAVHHWLTPLFEGWGVPLVAADIAGFVLALLVITFIHLVVGEMAPKSWAIAHPEKSATLLAPLMRAFMAAFRPVLRALNASANALLRKVGVEPVDEVAAGHSPATLRHLVEHSVNVGALDPGYSSQISEALQMQDVTIAELVRAGADVAWVPSHATVADVREVTAPAAAVGRPVFSLPAGTTMHIALKQMRETRNHLAVVTEGDRVVGVVTLTDVLRRLFPQPETVA